MPPLHESRPAEWPLAEAAEAAATVRAGPVLAISVISSITAISVIRSISAHGIVNAASAAPATDRRG